MLHAKTMKSLSKRKEKEKEKKEIAFAGTILIWMIGKPKRIENLTTLNSSHLYQHRAVEPKQDEFKLSVRIIVNE